MQVSIVTATKTKKNEERGEHYDSPPMKVGRDAFLYLEPASKIREFAQCGSCCMYVSGSEVGKKTDRCVLHGSKVEISGSMSCGLYVPGKPTSEDLAAHAEELRSGRKASVTPDESGLVDRKVRCENCYYFDSGDGDCELFEALNKQNPRLFELEETVEPGACCNAQTKKEK